MRFIPKRMQVIKKGFRPRQSKGYFIFDTQERRWVTGPFKNYGVCMAQCKALGEQVTEAEKEFSMSTQKNDPNRTGNEPEKSPAEKTSETSKTSTTHRETEKREPDTDRPDTGSDRG